jgi:hypothetical protein
VTRVLRGDHVGGFQGLACASTQIVQIPDRRSDDLQTTPQLPHYNPKPGAALCGALILPVNAGGFNPPCRHPEARGKRIDT